MMVAHFLKNIYFYSVDNFTFLHVYSLIITIIAILITVVFLYVMKTKSADKVVEKKLYDEEDKKNGLQAKYKMAKQKLLEKQYSINRGQRLEEEQKYEQQTLKTVMELLQQQSGSEKTLTMNELQEQLDLYRAQM